MDKRYYEVYDPGKTKKPKPHLTWGGFANITIFIVGVAVIGVLSVVLPKPETSEFEGRRLAKMPKLTVQSFFSGEFMEKLDLFYADTFPFRDMLVEAAAQYEGIKGFNADDVTIHGKAPVINEDYDETSSASAEPEEDTASSASSESSLPAEGAVSEEQEESTPPEPGEIELDGEMKEGVFVVGNRAMSLFGTDPAFGKRYANVISSYRQRFGDDVTIYNLVIPTQSEFKLPEKYKKLSASQKKSIDSIYASLDPSVKAVDAYSAMERHKDEYLYFRTDHHWTPLGAYYAYTAFCKTAGFTPVKLSEMEKKTKTDFLGSLYRTTQDPRLKNSPDYMDYYKVPVETKSTVYFPGQRNTPTPTQLYAEYAKGVNTYSLFLGGDWPLFVIESNAGTGRTIAVVKESFGNAFAPYLASHYDKVYVVDQRYFEKDFVKFVKDEGIKEVLFINNSFAANTPVHINWINNLNIEKPWPEPKKEEEPSSSEPDDNEPKQPTDDEWEAWLNAE